MMMLMMMLLPLLLMLLPAGKGGRRRRGFGFEAALIFAWVGGGLAGCRAIGAVRQRQQQQKLPVRAAAA